MKVQRWRSAAFIAAIMIFGFATAQISKAQEVKVDKNNRTIAVTASDKAMTDADLAVVHARVPEVPALPLETEEMREDDAAYAFGFAKNHAFVDGNKRIAFIAMTISAIVIGSLTLKPVTERHAH